MKRFSFGFLFLILISGCAWFGHKSPQSAKVNTDGQMFKAVDFARLNQGGTLLIQPFRAGAGVEVTPDLEQTAEVIKNTIANELKNGLSNFTVQTEGLPNQADLVLQGHINQMSQPSKVKKWMGKKFKVISISGKLIESSTGKEVFVFSDIEKIKNNKDSFEQLGRALSRRLANAILAQVNK